MVFTTLPRDCRVSMAMSDGARRAEKVKLSPSTRTILCCLSTALQWLEWGHAKNIWLQMFLCADNGKSSQYNRTCFWDVLLSTIHKTEQIPTILSESDLGRRTSGSKVVKGKHQAVRVFTGFNPPALFALGKRKKETAAGLVWFMRNKRQEVFDSPF